MSEPQRNLTADELEVVEGTEHHKIEGWVPELATDEDVRNALEEAFDYRGDVTITLKDGTRVEGYIFDRRKGSTLANSVVRMIPQNSAQKFPYRTPRLPPWHSPDAIPQPVRVGKRGCGNTGSSKAAGEKGIALEPEALE